MDDELEQALNERYRLVAPLGTSSDARTWRAEERDTGDEVVVKALSIRHADSWKALELFEREAEVLQQLDHPAVPDYRDAFHLGDDVLHCVLVQSHVDGETLEEQLAEMQGLPLFDEAEARAFLDEMFGLLEYLHGLNPPVVHRDIKPANIIERPDGSRALVDFGTVQAEIPQTTTGSTFVGTTGYMAPEQLAGRARPASDLFALGATTIQLLSGFHPGQLPVREMEIQCRSVVDASDEMLDFLERLVAPAVEDRVESASAAREALERLEPLETSVPAVDDLEAPDSPNLEIERTDEALTVEFPLGPRRPWSLLAFTFSLLLVLFVTIEMFVSTGIPATVFALLGLGTGGFGLLALERPRLRVTSETFEIEFARPLGSETASGRTEHLDVELDAFQINDYTAPNQTVLVARHGVEEYPLGRRLFDSIDDGELEYVQSLVRARMDANVRIEAQGDES